jgi:transposase
MDRDSLAWMLAEGLSLAQIGKRCRRHPSTVEYWVHKHGLSAANSERHAAKGGIPRARLQALIDDGLSVRGIADELGLGATTVRYWLRKHALSTRPMDRRRQTREARRDGQMRLQRVCKTHGLTDFWLEGSGYYRCLRCRWERVARRRKKIKATLMQEAGGRCRGCGYSRCASALGFHHLDPASKQFTIAQVGATISLERLRAEARKCVLLCANCHAEVESGLATVVGPTSAN